MMVHPSDVGRKVTLLSHAHCSNLNRPSGHVTGPKRLELFNGAMPRTPAIATLANAKNPNAESEAKAQKPSSQSAVGTVVTDRPRPDPCGRDSRTRLPPRVFDGEALTGPRMEDAGPGKSFASFVIRLHVVPSFRRRMPGALGHIGGQLGRDLSGH